jgi:hypothetical protein
VYSFALLLIVIAAIIASVLQAVFPFFSTSNKQRLLVCNYGRVESGLCYSGGCFYDESLSAQIVS